MARKERAALADLRALEEQAERANPIAPSVKRKQVKGAGATPSTGLSQKRGGRKAPSLKKMEAKMTPSLHNAEMGEMALMPSGEYDGAGKHTLMDHLAAPMKGFGDYLHAFESAGKEAAPAMTKAKKVLPGAVKKGGMKTGKYEGEGATPSVGLSQFRGGMAMGQVVGSGKPKKAKAAPAPSPVMSEGESDCEDDMAKAVGGAVKMECEVASSGKKKRASAGPNDGRRKRAEIVRKVMADKGLSMIEASKYVKAHGLY